MSEEQTNGIDSTTAKLFVGDILSSLKRTRGIRDKAKEDIRPELEEEVETRTRLYKAAESAGLPLLALKLEVGRQKLDWENELRKKAKEEAAGEDTLELADMIKEVLGEFASSPLGDAAVKAAASGKAANKAPAKKASGKKGGKGGEKVDTSVAAKADALSVGEGDEDLRGTRQKEREEARKAEVAERLKGIKPLDDQQTAH